MNNKSERPPEQMGRKRSFAPVWGMALLAALSMMGGCRKGTQDTSAAPATSSETKERSKVFLCPMHPTYTSDRPGECPICHMDLVPADELEEETEVETPPGRKAVAVSAQREQWIGVRTSKVEEKELVRVVRAGAKVAFDPELYSLLAEYNEFVLQRDRAIRRKDARDRTEAESLIRSSEVRLSQWGLTGPDARRMLKKGSTGVGPDSGSVYVQVYQEDARWVKPGQRVELTSPALSSSVWGRVQSVDRVVDPMTRTLRARVTLENEKTPLPLESYLEAAIQVSLGKKRSIPKEAIIDTGRRKIVYVLTEPGHYAPREVVTGLETDENIEIRSGLEEGEVVAVSGQFLLDSESQLKSVVSSGGDHAH